jgi:hypothetical protein
VVEYIGRSRKFRKPHANYGSFCAIEPKAAIVPGVSTDDEPGNF